MNILQKNLANSYSKASQACKKKVFSKSLVDSADTSVIPLAEAERLVRECLEALGTPLPYARAMASILIQADYRGHFSHGMNRLEMYVDDISSGTCNCQAGPKLLKETASTGWVDGQNGLGGVVGNYCMDMAIKKAKDTGVGWVVAKRSNHYGIAGWYCLKAMKESVIGMSFTNSSPLMSPTRSKRAALGTNPISLGAQGRNEDSFLLDMATSAVALGKIEIQRRKGLPIPEGWALDDDGNITTDTEKAFKATCLMPLGGTESNSGYKGYGLGALVDLICGVLSGSAYGPLIRLWNDKTKVADLGQCFVAVNPGCFAPGFEDRLSDFLNLLRNMEPIDPKNPVLVPGDPEKAHMIAVDTAGGVRYLPDQMKTCDQLAKKLKVKPLQPVSSKNKNSS